MTSLCHQNALLTGKLSRNNAEFSYMKPCRPLYFLSCEGEYKKLSGNNSEFNFSKKTFANSAMRSSMMMGTLSIFACCRDPHARGDRGNVTVFGLPRFRMLSQLRNV